MSNPARYYRVRINKAVYMSAVLQIGPGYYGIDTEGITINKSVTDEVDKAFQDAGWDLEEMAKVPLAEIAADGDVK